MAAAYVKCLYCEQKFNRNDPSIKAKQVSARRYAHLHCWEEHIKNMTQEEKDEQEFYLYAKQLFGEDYNYILTKKLAERYVKENKYTYSGMLKSLKWFYEKEGNPIDDSNGTIGIIPYIYSKAAQYYYKIFLAKKINQQTSITSKIKEIFIESPRKNKKPHLWLEEDETNEY